MEIEMKIKSAEEMLSYVRVHKTSHLKCVLLSEGFEKTMTPQ